ncbi:BspA family leucine-rich repeat surface protein [Mycoplasma yeatsii]
MNEVFKDSQIHQQDLNWNTENVTSMKSMFENSQFNGHISSWNVKKVTDMSKMFHKAIKFNSSISSWEVDSLKDISNMFNGAVIFNQDISHWDIKNERFVNVNNVDINTPAWEDKNKPFPRTIQLKDISEIISKEDRDLGKLNTYNNEDLKTKILKVLKQKYPKLDFDSLVLEINSNTQATLKSVEGENRRYKNQVIINYSNTNKTVIIASSVGSVGGAGIIGAVWTFIRRGKRK